MCTAPQLALKSGDEVWKSNLAVQRHVTFVEQQKHRPIASAAAVSGIWIQQPTTLTLMATSHIPHRRSPADRISIQF